MWQHIVSDGEWSDAWANGNSCEQQGNSSSNCGSRHLMSTRYHHRRCHPVGYEHDCAGVLHGQCTNVIFMVHRHHSSLNTLEMVHNHAFYPDSFLQKSLHASHSSECWLWATGTNYKSNCNDTVLSLPLPCLCLAVHVLCSFTKSFFKLDLFHLSKLFHQNAIDTRQ